MTRRTRLVLFGSVVAGIVALLVLIGRRGEPAGKHGAGKSEAAGSSRVEPVARLPIELPAPAASRHGLPYLGPAPEPPKSGRERLEYLRHNLGHTYASIALIKLQLDALRALSSPNQVQREALESVPQALQKLEEQAREQEDEIEHFDVSAPPEVYNPYPRKGPPTKVSTALDLNREQWNALLAREYAGTTLSDTAFERLERELLDAKAELSALRVPAGVAPKVQQEFLLIVDGLVKSETMQDRSAAQELLAARWQEFWLRARALSVDRKG